MLGINKGNIMSILSEIKKLEASEILLYVTILFVMISPGAAIIYHFNHELFINLTIWKLILLSTSITLPGLILNTLLSTSLSKSEPIKSSHLFTGAIITVLYYYTAFLLSIYFHWSSLICLSIIASLEGISSINIVIEIKRWKAKSANTKKIC
jgi:hypothetical protein